MKTAISALVALVIGAGGMYLLEQGKLTNLQSSMSALETQLSEAKTSAEASAAEVTKLQEAGKALEAEVAGMKANADAAAAELKSALEAKTQEVSTLQAKVAELETALTAAKSGAGTAQ